jgi:hypothetical protein
MKKKRKKCNLLKNLSLPGGANSSALERVSKAVLLDCYRILIRQGGERRQRRRAYAH